MPDTANCVQSVCSFYCMSQHYTVNVPDTANCGQSVCSFYCMSQHYTVNMPDTANCGQSVCSFYCMSQHYTANMPDTANCGQSVCSFYCMSQHFSGCNIPLNYSILTRFLNLICGRCNSKVRFYEVRTYAKFESLKRIVMEHNIQFCYILNLTDTYFHFF